MLTLREREGTEGAPPGRQGRRTNKKFPRIFKNFWNQVVDSLLEPPCGGFRSETAAM